MSDGTASRAMVGLGRGAEMAAWFIGFLVAWELLVRISGGV